MQLGRVLSIRVPNQDFDDLEPKDCPPNPGYGNPYSKIELHLGSLRAVLLTNVLHDYLCFLVPFFFVG